MRALSNGEFEPYLQPVVSASYLTVSGAELSEVKAMLPRGFRLAVNVTPALLAEREFIHSDVSGAGRA